MNTLVLSLWLVNPYIYSDNYTINLCTYLISTAWLKANSKLNNINNPVQKGTYLIGPLAQIQDNQLGNEKKYFLQNYSFRVINISVGYFSGKEQIIWETNRNL